MLDDGDSLVRELVDGAPCGVSVQDVVVGKFLAMELLGTHHPASPRCVGVQRGLLVRVLTIAKLCHTTHSHGHLLGEGIVRASHPRRDDAVIEGDVGECSGSQSTSLFRRRSALCDALCHPLIVSRVYDHCYCRVVLGRRSQHCGPTDVDVLQDLLVGDALS